MPRENYRPSIESWANTNDVLKRFFVDAGIPFPPGTGIIYKSRLSLLIVTNTKTNLTYFERILPQLRLVPDQLAFDACFVETGRTDADGLYGNRAVPGNACIADFETQQHIDELVAQCRAAKTCRPRVTTVSGNSLQISFDPGSWSVEGQAVAEFRADTDSAHAEVPTDITYVTITPKLETDREAIHLTYSVEHRRYAKAIYRFVSVGPVSSSRGDPRVAMLSGTTSLLTLPDLPRRDDLTKRDTVVLLLLTCRVVQPW